MAAGIADKDHGPGAFVRVACSATCDIKGTIKVTYNMRVFLRLKSKTVGTGKGHLAGAGAEPGGGGGGGGRAGRRCGDAAGRGVGGVRRRHGNQLPVRLDATAKDG